MGIYLEVDADSGDTKIAGKVDIGGPGSGKGLDIGEGGSYQTGMVAYNYDASQASGSRFTEIADLDAQNTLLGDQGDRVYFGCANKFWAFRLLCGIAKTAEQYLIKYWNGALVASTYMGIDKETALALGKAILENLGETEYIVWDKDVDDDWATADNQLDTIPNTGTSLYWICLEVPVGGFATAPRVDEIKIRGTDFDVKSDTSAAMFWGKGRYLVHERIPLDLFRKGAAAPPINDINITATQSQALYTFRTGQNDDLSYRWKLPHDIDTSCKIAVSLCYMVDGAINTLDIYLDIKMATDGTALGAGETSNYAATESLILAAGDANKHQMSNITNTGGKLDISDFAADDLMYIYLKRSDANGNNCYGICLTLHYVTWTLGEHV